MATYSNLKNGSSGQEVKDLQNALIKAGYDVGTTGADGIYGAKTQAAVKKYQQDHGLSVDGIAGKLTQGSLYSANTATAPSATTASTAPTSPAASTSSTATQTTITRPAAYTSSVSAPKAYDPARDKAYQQAIASLQAVQKQTPTYAGTYDAQLKDLYDQIVNRDKFSYDINEDMLYKQYKDQYIDQGRLAMQDTMGQAAALTGGYGSSYGQSVGQQQYDAYLQKLNEVVPELYNQAYQQYRDEGDQLARQYSMMGDLADDEYAKYSDAYNRWLTERDYAQGLADQAYNRGYTAYQDALDQYNRDRAFEYDQYQDTVSQYYQDLGIDFDKEQADREYQLALDKFAYEKEQDAAAMAAAGVASSGGSSSGSGSRKSSGVGYNNGSLSSAQVKQLQNTLGVTADGKWGSDSSSAAGGLSADEAWEKYMSKGSGDYTSQELLDAAASEMSKAQIEEVLKNRGVNINSAAVQADIKWALSK